jgi:hypothetical protein
MIFALLTLLSALSLAGVAGWFSIIGITAIYAAMPIHAIIMGIVLEAGKLVTTSWLYRNWDYSSWKLRAPLILFTIILMLATSIGVYGFLSKAHLEQGASTVDNSAKIERLDQQIAREKSVITDDEKVIGQLDSAINSYIGKDRTDKSVAVRKSQTPQRNQLRSDIDTAQKRIDTLSDEKLKLTSEVRELQLEVGPIRYIAELIYGTDGNTEKNIEAAVRMFTLLIVSTLDPLAVILLIAANHTLLRRENEKKQKEEQARNDGENIKDKVSTIDEINSQIPTKDTPAQEQIPGKAGLSTENSSEIPLPILPTTLELLNEETTNSAKEDKITFDIFQPVSSEIDKCETPLSIIREILQAEPHTGTSNEEPTIYSPIQKVENETTYTLVLEQQEEVGSSKDLETSPGTIQDVGMLSSKETSNIEHPNEGTITWPKISKEKINEEENTILEAFRNSKTIPSFPIIRQPTYSRVIDAESSTLQVPATPSLPPTLQETIAKKIMLEQDSTMREIFGHTPHFVAERIHEEEKPTDVEVSSTPTARPQDSSNTKETETIPDKGSSQDEVSKTDAGTLVSGVEPAKTHKYPKALSWLTEFKRI